MSLITLRNSTTSVDMVTTMVDKWIIYNQKKTSYSVLARKEFKKQFEDDLKFYSDATIKEMTELYGK